MKRTHLEALLWVLALAIAVLAWRAAKEVVPPVTASAEQALAAPPEPLRLSETRLGQAARAIAASDPFRLDRRPSAVAFSAAPDAVNGMMVMPPPPPPPPPRPQLSVSGIVGPPWTALLDGVPGRDGPVLVRTGDQVDVLRIRQVGPREVVVAGMDTTWRLTIKRTWQ
jgi:hypothetical protein